MALMREQAASEGRRVLLGEMKAGSLHIYCHRDVRLPSHSPCCYATMDVALLRVRSITTAQASMLPTSPPGPAAMFSLLGCLRWSHTWACLSFPVSQRCEEGAQCDSLASKRSRSIIRGVMISDQGTLGLGPSVCARMCVHAAVRGGIVPFGSRPCSCSCCCGSAVCARRQGCADQADAQ